MRALHLADLHLGVENYGRPNGETGLNARLEDFLAAFDMAVDHAIGHEVDLVLFCGDAYKTRHPSSTCQREFARRIKRLSEAGIPVVLLAGNHDVHAALGKAHTLEIFGALKVPGVIVADRPATHVVETRAGPVQVVTIPWPVTSHLLTKEQTRGMTAEDVDMLIADLIGEAIEEEARQLDPHLPSFLMGHLTVFGATFSGERSVMLGSESVLPLASVARPEFDYVALGHLHRHQILKDNPPVMYSGSLERIDFGEEGEEKGFVVIDIEPDGTRVTFVPVAARPFQTIDVKVGGDDPTAQVIEAIGQYELEGRVVRLIIRTDEEGAARLRDGEIYQALAGAHHVASVTKDVERVTRLRLGDRKYEEMTPMELLRLYLESAGTPGPRIETLLEAAEGLMAEVGT